MSKDTKTKENAAQLTTEEATGTTPEADEMQATQAREIPEGYKYNREIVETKSRHVQMLMQPSLYKELKKLSRKHKTSVNNYLHTLLKNHVEELKK